MRAKEIIGKKVIDATGNEVGEVEDVELDWENKMITHLVIGGKGERAERILGRLGARATPDVKVSVEDVVAVGEVVIVKTKIG